jgi:hypothetical protein
MSSEPGATVELTTDDQGVPLSARIDLPDAIDDEECYEVGGFAALG